MGDGDVGLLVANLVAGIGELAEGRTGIPCDYAWLCRLPAARILVVERAGRAGAGRHAAIAAAVLVVPLLNDVGLDRQDTVAGRRETTAAG